MIMCFCSKPALCLINLNELTENYLCKEKKCKYNLIENILNKNQFVICGEDQKIISNLFGKFICRSYIDFYGNCFFVDINKPIKYNPYNGERIDKIYDGILDSVKTYDWEDLY